MAVNDYEVFENVEVVCDGNGYNSSCYLKPITALSSNGGNAYLVLKDSIGNNIENGKVDYYVYFSDASSGILRSGIKLFESSYDANDYLVNFFSDIVAKGFQLYINGGYVKGWGASSHIWHHVVIDWWLEDGSYFVKVIVNDDNDNSYIQSISPSNFRWHMYFYQNAGGDYFKVDDLRVYKRWS